MTEATKATVREVPLPGIEPERRLRFRTGSIREAQEKSGRPFGELFLAAMTFDVVALATLFWAGLKHEDSDLTQAEADKLMDQLFETGITLNEMADLLSDAVHASNLLERRDG